MGDGDGVMVIPLVIAEEISLEAIAMERFEAYVIAKVRTGSKVIGLYPPTDKVLEEYNQTKLAEAN